MTDDSLREQLRTLLSRHCTMSHVRRIREGGDLFDRPLWSALAEAGWLGAAVPEEQGGLDLGAAAAAMFAEELGRALAPVPVESSIFIVADALLRHGGVDLLGETISGARIGTLAIVERQGPIAEALVTARVTEGRLTGRKIAVVDGLAADFALVAARDGDTVGLHVVDLAGEGVSRWAAEAIDPARPLATIDFADAPAEPLGADWAAIESLLDRAAVLTAFQQIGGADTALKMALDYAAIRHTFGRPIGSYQAIKHKLAHVHVAITLARAAADAALAQFDGSALPAAAAVARLLGTAAFEEAAREMVQTHGGIGVTYEHDAQLVFRRARHLACALGTGDQWRHRLAGLMLDGDAVLAATPEAGDGEDAAFRRDARTWLAANAPEFETSAGGDRHSAEALARARAWHARKREAGYVGIGLPAKMGGLGSPARLAIFKEEEGRYRLPPAAFFLGEGVIVPVLMAVGATDHLDRFAARAIAGDDIWCEAFSEPSAGSDIAGLRTKARRDGDDWIIDGQKVWTSYAKWSDWGMLLARTDPAVAKHHGLTMFLLDLRTPGVDVRPLRTMTGDTEFNEIFLDEVRIPDAMRLGGVGEGWKLFNITLLTERLAVLSHPAVNRNVLEPLIAVGRRTPGPDGRMLIEDAGFRRELADYHALISAVGHFQSGLLDALCRGEAPGAEASIGKLAMAKPLQRMAARLMDLLGPGGAVLEPGDAAVAEAQESFFWATIYRIAGGADEIMLNLVSEQMLGMAREARADKDVPFDRLAPTGAVRAA